jgi:cobalamin biosynthesis Mg chelatase CobN
MLVDEYQYSNLGGYGIFCGRKCVAEKQAQGIPPKRGKKNIAAWEAEQAQRTQMMQQQQNQQAGGSRTGLIVGGLALVVIAGIAIYVIRKRKQAA